MTLIDWLDEEGMSQKEFAEVVGVNKSTINRMINGTESPSSDEIRAIFLATNGRVTVDDWANQFEQVGNWIDVVIECQTTLE